PPLPEEGATPHVTILMATRDRAALLKEAIASLAAQTLSDWQAVIVDDGSTDGSAAFLERLAARDHRDTLRGGAGRGPGEALARALPEARGQLLLILDDDDRLAPRMLELASAALERASGGSGDPPEAGAVVTDAVIIDERGAIRGVRSTPAVHPRSMGRALLEGCYLLQPTVLLRRREVEAAGGFRRELRRLQDYDLWWRLAGRIDWIHLPLPLAQVRTHGGNRKDPRLRGEIAAAAQGILRRVRKEVPLEELFPDLAEASDERERLRVETEARFELARALLRLRLFGEAVEEMRAIIERTAETVPVTCLLARALLGAGEREEAERLFGSILAGNPGDGNALNGLGLCRAGAGDWDGAERHFRRALQAAPSHLVSRVNWLHARMGGEMPAEVADFHRGVIAREDPPGVEYLILEIEQGVRDGDEAGAGS
ncbi:MAG: glycosyltransferase, partial [Planctomycetota bacterium]